MFGYPAEQTPRYVGRSAGGEVDNTTRAVIFRPEARNTFQQFNLASNVYDTASSTTTYV